MPDSPSLQAITQAMGCPNHSGWENGQGPPCQGHRSKVPRDKSLGPMLPLPSALTSAHPSINCTAISSFLPASWGLTLTLGLPWRGPSQGGWHRYAGPWGPPSPSARLTLPKCRHPGPSERRGSFRVGEQAVPSHSGRENGLCPLSTRQLSKAPCAKTLGPTLPLPSTHTLACPPLTAQPWLGPAASWGLH